MNGKRPARSATTPDNPVFKTVNIDKSTASACLRCQEPIATIFGIGVPIIGFGGNHETGQQALWVSGSPARLDLADGRAALRSPRHQICRRPQALR